jgi:hypothetical protein
MSCFRAGKSSRYETLKVFIDGRSGLMLGCFGSESLLDLAEKPLGSEFQNILLRSEIPDYLVTKIIKILQQAVELAQRSRTTSLLINPHLRVPAHEFITVCTEKESNLFFERRDLWQPN